MRYMVLLLPVVQKIMCGQEPLQRTQLIRIMYYLSKLLAKKPMDGLVIM